MSGLSGLTFNRQGDCVSLNDGLLHVSVLLVERRSKGSPEPAGQESQGQKQERLEQELWSLPLDGWMEGWNEVA